MTTGRTLVADFLRARRELVQPDEVGLPRDPHRRVPGLRREEVAELAGISAEYYVRLEQGRDHQPSDQVLAALARALRLDDDAFSYLKRVARESPVLRAVPTLPPLVSPSVLQLLAQWSHTPAYVSDRNHDVLAANASARALAPGYLEAGSNLLLGVFAETDPDERVDDWNIAARSLVDSLRFHGDPSDPRLQEIVGSLSVRNRDFRRMWAHHNPRPQVSGVTPSHVAQLGWVEFNWQTLEVPGQRGLFLTTFFGTPGSRAAAAIAYLAATVRADSTAPSVQALDVPAASINRDIAS
jgi:transcriptional regulator with XRE-family HTH domain